MYHHVVALRPLVESPLATVDVIPSMASSFFKQLMDLGEEKPGASAQQAMGDADDLLPLDKQQLVAIVLKQRTSAAANKAEFDALREESVRLRSEYDAYKLKIESWQLKMKEARDADKRLIEQLRAAGSTGGTDELLIKSLNDTISKYKEELRAAKDDVAREYQRRQETEEARARFEESKKAETEALIMKFERTLEQVRQAKTSAENKLRQTEDKLDKALADLRDAQAKWTATQQQKERATVEKLRTAAAASDTPGTPHEESDPPQSPQDEERWRIAATRIAELESLVAEQRQQLSVSRDELQRLTQVAQEAQDELLTSEKRSAEARAAADAEATRHTAALAEAERKLAAIHLEKAELQRQLRVLEDELHNVRDARLREGRATEERVADLQSEIASLRASLQARDDAVGAAEQYQLRVTEAVASERRQLESLLAAAERRSADADAQRRAAEQMLADLRAELRRRDEAFDELRSELEEQTQRAAEAESQLAMNHALVSSREDDLVAREREKQSLKHALHLEKETVERLRRQLTEYDERTEDERARMNTLLTRLADLEGDRTRLQAELRVEKQRVADAAVAMDATQRNIRDLQRQLSDQGSRAADALRNREDQSAKVRHLELQVREAEQRLQTALEREVAAPALTDGGSHRISSMHHSQQPPAPSAILSSAFSGTGGRMPPWGSNRTIIAVGVLVLIVLGFLNSFPTAQRAGDTDTVTLLKEKYSQALQSAVSCREASKGLCPCQPPLANTERS